MPIVTACKSCGKNYRLPDRAAGKSVICRKCKKQIHVPRTRSANNADPRRTSIANESSSNKQPTESSLKAILIVSGGAVVFFLCVTLFLYRLVNPQKVFVARGFERYLEMRSVPFHHKTLNAGRAQPVLEKGTLAIFSVTDDGWLAQVHRRAGASDSFPDGFLSEYIALSPDEVKIVVFFIVNHTQIGFYDYEHIPAYRKDVQIRILDPSTAKWIAAPRESIEGKYPAARTHRVRSGEVAWKKVDEFIRSYPQNEAEANERELSEAADRSVIGTWSFDKERTEAINGERLQGTPTVTRIRFFEIGWVDLESHMSDRSIKTEVAKWNVLTTGQNAAGQLIHQESMNGPATGKTTTFEIDVRYRLDNRGRDEYLYLGNSPGKTAFIKVGWPAPK